MKYNLDDLISKSFEGKEKVSPEFAQSVIKGLQEGSGGRRRRNGGIIAAACAGVVIVAGVTALMWKDGTSVQKDAEWKTSGLQAEKTFRPDTRNNGIQEAPGASSANTEDKVGGKSSIDNPAASRQKAASVNSENEAVSVSDSQDSKSEKIKKYVKDEKLEMDKKSEKREKQDTSKKPEKHSDNTKKDDSNSSDNQNPSDSSEEKKPTATAKPEKPGTSPEKPTATAKPAEPGTIKVLGNYVQLCSMRQLGNSDNASEMQHVITSSSLVEEAVKNTAIYTYEQLQEYREKTRERFLKFELGEGKELFLSALEEYFQGLRQYDKAYFEKNVLYIHNAYVTSGYDFRLHAVDAVEKEDGKKVLDVQIERFWPVPEDVCTPCVMENHMLVVEIPKDVAEKCDSIEGQIVGMKLEPWENPGSRDWED